MSFITTEQLARVRARPHRTKLYLGIFDPKTVAVGQLDSTNEKSEVALSLTWLTGNYTQIRSGMTVYIGIEAGGSEHGRYRVRSAGSATLNIAENSEDWQAGTIVTVVEYYEPWTVFPRITLDADNVPTFYKDYDVSYTNQNQVMDPVVCMGPNHAGFLATGSYSVHYTSSGSFDPTPGASHITGSVYDWYFGESGFVDPTGSTAVDPGYVTYHSGGYYTTRLTVTRSNDGGKDFTGYRHVMIYDRPGEGPERPYLKWGIEGLDGSRDDGGYTTSIWIREEAGYSRVQDGSLVVVFSDDWQGSNEGAIGGNAEKRESILFVGYIAEGSIEMDPISNKMTFEVASVTGAMKELSNYSTTLESEENAVTWYQMRRMTVDRAVIHLLRWQSTVLAVADFAQTEDDKQVQYADFDRGNLFDSANSFLESTLGAQMVSDRQGKIWCEIDLNLKPTGTSRDSYITAIDIERRDWRDAISFGLGLDHNMAYMEYGGIAYSGPGTGTFDAFIGGAPGDAQRYRGGIERGSGLVISGQDQLNVFVGNMLAKANAEFGDLEIPLAGDYRFIDIAPQERISFTLAASENWRGLTWDQMKFIPASVSFGYNPGAQSLLTDIEARQETWATEAADTIIIPDEPPYNYPGLPEWEIKFPPIIPLVPVVPIPDTTAQLQYIAETNRIVRCRDMLEASPTFEAVDEINNFVTGSFVGFQLDSSDPINTAWAMTSGGGEHPWVWRINNLDTSPVVTAVLTPAIFFATTGYSGNTKARAFSVSPINQNIIHVLCGDASGGVTGDYGVIYTADGGVTWAWKKMKVWPYYGIKPDRVARVEASEHASPIAHTSGFGVNVPANSDGIIRTDTFWSLVEEIVVYTANVQDWHIPFHNNGDQKMYVAKGQGTGKRLTYSDDSYFSNIDITPEFNGNKWAVNRYVRKRAITTFHGDSNIVAAFLNPDEADGASDSFATFFLSSTGPTGLYPVFSTNSNMQVIEMNKANPDIILGMGQKIAPGVTSLFITQDRGLTWLNHMVKYRSDLGLAADYNWSPVRLQNVWVV